MNKKGNIPSIRDLRDAIAKDKKNMDATDTRHLRLRIYADRWDLEGGSSHFVGDEDPHVVHAVYFVTEKKASSYVAARVTLAMLRNVISVETL